MKNKFALITLENRFVLTVFRNGITLRGLAGRIEDIQSQTIERNVILIE